MRDVVLPPDEDAAVHLHLACAYREMGLMDEALHEFEVAATDPDLRFSALEGLADCYRDLGDPPVAG